MIEGTGLLLRPRRAEYFTVGVTASFIPLQLYEPARRFTVTRVVIIAINLVVAWYLVHHLRRGTT